jgi:hypothetical protein
VRTVKAMDLFALFHPSAGDARLDWQARQQLPAPVPSPDGPGRIDGGRIVIEVDEPPC